MNVKHLQLNTSVLRDPSSIMNYIISQNIDIACLQEVKHRSNEKCILENLANENSYNYFESKNFHIIETNEDMCVAVITRFNPIDNLTIYFNSENYLPKNISNKDILGSNLPIFDDKLGESLIGSRGIKHAHKSRAIQILTLQIPGGKLVRVINTHYTVSDHCSETLFMLKQSELIKSIIDFARDLPTILSMDMNLRIQSYSGHLLKSILFCHTDELKNTLSDNHVAIKNDFPEGLAIDQVFSKHLGNEKSKTEPVSFSDHKTILTNFIL